MARRASWLLLLAFGGAASACSLITSWDDVKLGAIGTDSGTIDAASLDSGSGDASANDSGPIDAGSDACTPGTVICIDSTSTGGAPPPELYACNDAGTFDPPVDCLHECVHAGPTANGNDSCSCNPGDTYCGGDNVIGDRDSLYECNVGGPPTFKEKCSIQCVIHPGANDQCNL